MVGAQVMMWWNRIKQAYCLYRAAKWDRKLSRNTSSAFQSLQVEIDELKDSVAKKDLEIMHLKLSIHHQALVIKRDKQLILANVPNGANIEDTKDDR